MSLAGAPRRPTLASRLKPAKAPNPTERSVQRTIVQGLRAHGLAVVAVPNGGQYVGNYQDRIRQAFALRADGVVSGFPDLIVMTKRLKPGLVGFLEVKREKASLASDHAERQLECHAAMRADHQLVALVRSFEEALETVRSWGFLPAASDGARETLGRP